ncbi:MAG: DUF1015 domain-containing protein [Phycisphaerales bacterium]|jgi:uncharacterized protein (DUF1015 family)|nr:DUF1015 domain-containing protein [Phycisphaerales bacterium]
MPAVHPFRAAQYATPAGVGRGDVSSRIAPPYDVLSSAQKQALLTRDPANVVALDLPHVPAKELGPPSAYENAAGLYRQWLSSGTLARRDTPAMFAYRQRFTQDGKRYERCGMSCTLDVVPFGPRAGGGILPHEQTFSGPKEDRMALMKASRAQFSPIFGLFADESGRGSAIVRAVMDARPADLTGDMGDRVTHEVWTIDDDATLSAYRDALAGEDVFIADGHHRYNTALNYLGALEAAGSVPADHPARRCMMVLVGMRDPGLYIGPTHRVLGGMAGYSFDNFLSAAAGSFRFEPVAGGPAELERAVHTLTAMGPIRLGMWDFASRRGMVAIPTSPDPLAARFADKSKAWRTLDVAITQHLVVEDICEPKLNAGKPVKWAFPHTVAEVEEIGSGAETGAGGGASFAQLAVILRPTPLDAVRDVSRANELMPQKSTFFYPKLATGLWINPLA